MRVRIGTPTPSATLTAARSQFHVGPLVLWRFFGSHCGKLAHPGEKNGGPWHTMDACSKCMHGMRGAPQEQRPGGVQLGDLHGLDVLYVPRCGMSAFIADSCPLEIDAPPLCRHAHCFPRRASASIPKRHDVRVLRIPAVMYEHSFALLTWSLLLRALCFPLPTGHVRETWTPTAFVSLALSAMPVRRHSPGIQLGPASTVTSAIAPMPPARDFMDPFPVRQGYPLVLRFGEHPDDYPGDFWTVIPTRESRM